MVSFSSVDNSEICYFPIPGKASKAPRVDSGAKEELIFDSLVESMNHLYSATNDRGAHLPGITPIDLAKNKLDETKSLLAFFVEAQKQLDTESGLNHVQALTNEIQGAVDDPTIDLPQFTRELHRRIHNTVSNLYQQSLSSIHQAAQKRKDYDLADRSTCMLDAYKIVADLTSLVSNDEAPPAPLGGISLSMLPHWYMRDYTSSQEREAFAAVAL